MNTIRLYGSRISYYTGKMQAYLGYKEIPYEFVTLNPGLFRRLYKETGTGQMPAIELPDGRFITDTTPMIAWLEGQYPENSVMPTDPVMRCISLLLEDYAEEWLWRPAMHYRWSYKPDRLLLSRKIVDEIMTEGALPNFVKRIRIRRRQHGEYVQRDGVSADTWDHVESIYLNTLDRLEAIFSQRPWVLGERPSIADFGYFASMFRHFSQDPTPAEIMRRRAPAVFAWQARLWNARASTTSGELLSEVPADLASTLADMGSGYLPYLNQNARAWQQGVERVDLQLQGVPYRSVPVSQYRVWCLEQLQQHARQVPEDRQADLREALESAGCWAPLFEIKEPASRYDEGSQAPFRGRKVHYQNRRD